MPPRGTIVPDAALALEPRGSLAQRWLMLGVLAAGLALTLQLGILHRQPAPVMTAPMMAVPAKPAKQNTVAQKMPPSVFEQETAMAPAALIARWDPLVKQASKRFDVPQDWIRAVMRQESGGRTMLAENQKVISSAGAMGIMQVLPETYAEMRQQYGLGADPYDPHDNVFAGAAYLKWLHGKYGFPAMFAAYNDGPGHYEDHLQGRVLPAETKNYLKAIAGELGVGDQPVQLTRPDGSSIAIDVAQVSAVRAALPGEYASSVHAVVSVGRVRQGVQEDVAVVLTRLRQHGAPV